jgi:hypothetical protein
MIASENATADCQQRNAAGRVGQIDDVPMTRAGAPISALMLLALVAASRIPFVLTHYVQEDAYISARAIGNLVTHGALEFNLGDRYSPVTSLAWGYVAAIPALFLPREAMMLGFQLLGVASIGLAVLLLRGFLRSSWSAIALAVCSPALFASYLGMETGMCILYLAAAAVALSDVQRWCRAAFLLAAAGPVIRPEFIVISGLLVVLMFMTSGMRARDRWAFASAPALGALAYVTLNLLLSGEIISPTIIAKTLSYPHQRSLQAFWHNLVMVTTGQFILPGFKGFPPPWVHAVVNLSPLVLLVRRLLDRSTPLYAAEKRVLVFTVFVAYGLPCLFCYGGQFAQWYMFPSAFFAVFLALWCLPAAWHRHAVFRLAVPTALAVAALGQLALSYSVGTQEYGYRADVGRWLHRNSAPTATLLLEPAGYIPFYADLKTYDDVGLVSPVVLTYVRSYGTQWWFRFVRDSWPDWIVDRHDFRVTATTDSWYHLTASEHRCLLTHYELVRMFHYDPKDYAPNALALRVLKMGSNVNYYVYRLRPAAPAAERDGACSETGNPQAVN